MEIPEIAGCCTSVDRDGMTGNPNTRISRVDIDAQFTWSAHVDTLMNGQPSRPVNSTQVSQVPTESGRGGTGGRILDHTTNRKRVTRMEPIGVLRPEQVHRGPTGRVHHLGQLGEPVVEFSEPLPRDGRHYQVFHATKCDP